MKMEPGFDSQLGTKTSRIMFKTALTRPSVKSSTHLGDHCFLLSLIVLNCPSVMHTHPSSWCTRINQGNGERVDRSCSFLLSFLELKIYYGTGCTLRLEINLGKRKRTEGELGGGGTERNKRSNEDFLWWVKIISFDGGKYFSGNSNLFLVGDWRFPKKEISIKGKDILHWWLIFPPKCSV